MYDYQNTVELIKIMDKKGFSLNRMAETLNKEGFTTVNGKPFNTGTVSQIRLYGCKLPRRIKRGGRPKGSVNKSTRILTPKQTEMMTETSEVNKVEVMRKLLTNKPLNDTEIEHILDLL